MSTLKSVNLQHPSSASPNIVLDSSGNATMAGTMAMATPFAIRNKIINGAMEIDQRNAGASVTVTSDGTYGIDRWKYRTTLSSKFSVQRSTVAPPGFTNSLLATSLAATTPGTNDYYAVEQLIEGFNVADLSWGTVNARSVTLSFWVRSSLTGTFGGVIGNAAYNRSYPFTYSISSANTWEYKTVTIPGDTTGTWETGSSTGIDLFFGLGVGSGQSGAAGSWAAAGRVSATGAVNFVGTNGATFYLTGVQLEVGSVATPFERRLFGQELLLAQRYYEKSYDLTTATGAATTTGSVYSFVSAANGSRPYEFTSRLKVQKRISSFTLRLWSPVTGTGSPTIRNVTGGLDVSAVGSGPLSDIGYVVVFNPSQPNGNEIAWQYSAEAEL